MPTVTYIGHSGFAVEMEHSILLFDYYQGKLPDFDRKKDLYVFSSHAHHDHFSFDIFDLARGRDNVTYILATDIQLHKSRGVFRRHGVSRQEYDRICFVGPRKMLTIGSLTIETFASTDQGVALLVECEGSTIFHSGDLHDWVWARQTEAENRAMTARWQVEIARIQDRHVDIAFLVLDPRQKANFWRGFDWFMTHVDTGKAYPMHFWGDVSVIDRLRALECSVIYRDKIALTEEYQ